MPRAGSSLALALALSALLLLAAGAGSASAGAGAGRPNVIVLMTDDQTVADLRGMTHTRALLARRGVSFSRSFVSYPLCCPSRATYLTGQYPHNHGVFGLWAPTGGYGRLDKANTLPVWMAEAGYHSAHIGKFLNGYGTESPADVPPGWSEWYGAVDPTTYRMWGYTLNENGTQRTYGSRFEEDPELYQTDVYARKAVDFIERRAAEPDPFFLSVAFLAPHHEEGPVRARSARAVRPAPRHAGAHAGARLPQPRSFDEWDISDKPGFLRRRSPFLAPATIDRITRQYRDRQESLMAVDEAVRSIVGALERRGVLERTYILFTSDNGFLQGEHRIASGKMLPYEASARVPLLLSGPGVPAGRVSSEPVTNEDLAPTLVDIADGTPGNVVDGRSLLPFARRPLLRSQRYLLHETGGLKPDAIAVEDAGPINLLRSVLTYKALRTSRYLWVEYRNGSRELYDLARDPSELRSRHDDPRYRATRRALARELARLARCRGRSCRASGAPIPRPVRQRQPIFAPWRAR